MNLSVLLQLLDDNKIDQVFGRLQAAGIRDQQLARLREEFTSGVARTDVDYPRRLRLWLHTHLKTPDNMPTSSPDHGKHLKKLLAQGELGQVIKELYEATEINGQAELHSDIILHSARFNSNERGFKQGITSEANYNMEKARLNAAVQDALSHYEPDGSYTFDPNIQPGSGTTSPPTKPGVFISYNHQDKAIAQRIKTYLEKAGFPVTIDSEALGAGENIQAFIEESVRNNELTLSVVTSRSLLSAWVAQETINTFFADKLTSGKQFIAVFDDPIIFDRSFVDDALDKIEVEIQDIRKSMTRRLEKNRGIEDLQEELSRYQYLEHHLPSIMRRIKEHKSVPIDGDNFEQGMAEVVAALA